MTDFAHQVRQHCHACGVSMRGWGELANAPEQRGLEFVSAEHLSIYQPKRPSRQVITVTDRQQLQEQALSTMVDYIGNGSC